MKVYCWLDYYCVRLIIVYDFEIDIRLNTEFAPSSPCPLVTLPLVSVGGRGQIAGHGHKPIRAHFTEEVGRHVSNRLLKKNEKKERKKSINYS